VIFDFEFPTPIPDFQPELRDLPRAGLMKRRYFADFWMPLGYCLPPLAFAVSRHVGYSSGLAAT
jgi:hypothetical protein